MRFTWYGHASFLIEAIDDAGQPVRILTDPYSAEGCGGFAPVDEVADVVTLSHVNPAYHSDLSTIRGDYEAVWGLELPPEGVAAKGVPIRSFRVYENEARDPDGANAMIRFALEDLTVAHLGDLGHRLVGEELEFLRGADVLLALAGGPPTIPLPVLKELAEELKIPLVLPMHYAVPGIRLNIRPVEDFLSLYPPDQVVRLESSSLAVTRETLPEKTTVAVLKHYR
jgi:L-ascorbate metabolism protein UlaG (beta-lactamase superfamily)